MAPTPDDAAHLGDDLLDAYAETHTSLVGRIAKALGQGAGSLASALAKLNPLRKSSAKLIAALSKKVTKELPPLVAEAYDIGADQAAAELAALVAAEKFHPPHPPGAPAPSLPGPPNPDALAHSIANTFHPQLLRSVDDTYRRIVADVYGPAYAAGEPRLKASQRALDRMANEGITGFTDRSGRRWRPESYAEMALRTAFARAAVAGALDRYHADGVDLVGVPDIPFGCKECAPFEGKVLATHAGVKPPKGVTVYCTVAEAFTRGFGHPNCRHSLVPVIDAKSAAELQAHHDPHDEAGYRATQRQRELERNIRAAKRRLVVAQESDAPAEIVKARKQDVTRRQADIRAFLAAHSELLRQNQREQVRAPGATAERAV